MQTSSKTDLYFVEEKLYLSNDQVKKFYNETFLYDFQTLCLSLIFDRFLEVETCRSLVRSETENCVYVSEWRRKNGKIDPTHSCPMNIQVDLPKESAFVTDSSLLLAEKILSKLVRLVGTNTLIHRKTIYCERSEQ